MLTPKCHPRDFRVGARANSTKSRLYGFKRKSERLKNWPQFARNSTPLANATKDFYVNEKEWLGRQDSNLGSRDQNPLPYHLATPQFALNIVGRAARVTL
jgi:hypothetical protein